MAISETEIFERARQETGNKRDNSVMEVFIDDPSIQASIRRVVRDLNRLAGTGSTRKQVQFSAVAAQQAYTITTYVGADVYKIDDVWRSAQYIPDYISADDGFPAGPFNADSPLIHPGLQDDVFDTIVQHERTRMLDKFSWEQFGSSLYLFPTPQEAEVIIVRYTTNDYAVETLPDEAEAALVAAACVAILNQTLNRLNATRFTNVMHGQSSDDRIKTIKDQRDYYAKQYASEVAKLRPGL